MQLKLSSRHWVFDMDGTLTEAVHDFPAIKKELDLPLELDILTGLSLLDPDRRKEKEILLNQIELEIARKAKPQESAFELLLCLQERGDQLAILTRNSKENAILTLEAAGLLAFFPKPLILSRDEAKPKPDPEGLLHLRNLWSCPDQEMVMVGDYLYDLQAGKAAKATTIYLDPSGIFPFQEHATYCIRSLSEISLLEPLSM
ncbi:HAD hydrolase, family IA, variant 3 [Leptospira ryugenii]|uniref:HAD hydrolase, family IA, variant 3 n=1 Tax=Leptospira ryugenii TaxID=1917863 RepID=A0A2P2DXG5_9LEPT|nr:HAD hydrolase-like protein [Leptospira ryugenii]GBF49270.1 HAD hydrolase, family IA, variant 3 [Leptospira ryugenii]